MQTILYIRASRLFANFLEMNIPTHKPVSATTDGALAMTSEHLGLSALQRTVHSPTCVTHQQDLHTKVIDFEHMISVVQKPSCYQDFRIELREGGR